MSITVKRDLRSGRAVWLNGRLPRLAASRLARLPRFDVVVVGAGISGAMVAEHLTERGLTVAIVDRRGPVKGSTPASTALLQYEIDTPLSQLSREIGKQKAQRIWRRSRLALDGLRERVRHLGIAADWVNRDSLYLDGTELGPRKLYAEYLARREAGFETTFLEPDEVRRRFGIRGRSAILGYDNMSADPRRLAAEFLQVALRRGARLYAPHEVIGADCAATHVRLRLKSGQAISGRAVVFATGYEFLKGIPLKGHAIVSTWAIATKPQPRALWPGHCMIWEASDPYLYMRVSPDNRVICGGEDEEFADDAARDALMPEKTARIAEKLKKIFPKIDPAPQYAWCGSFGASDTGTPTIGPVPGMKNCYAMMGYGGNGITFSMMGAQLLTSMITGAHDPDADLFSFGRDF